MPRPTTAATANGRTQRGRCARSGGRSVSLTLSTTRGSGTGVLPRVTGASLSALAAAVAMLGSDDSFSSAATAGAASVEAVGAAGASAGGLGSTGAMPSNVCFSGWSVRGGDELGAGTVAAAGGGADGATGGELADAVGGSERCGITGAMPSKVCLRSGLVMSGVAVASGLLTTGVVVACDGVGTEARASGGAEEAGRGAALGDEAGRGGADERAAGNGVATLAAEAGIDERGAGAGVALSCGTRAGAGISSAPHSESMSSVGGAIDGRAGLPLTRSLSDLLSVIALPVAFSRPAGQIKPVAAKRDALTVQSGGFRRRRRVLSCGVWVVRSEQEATSLGRPAPNPQLQPHNPARSALSLRAWRRRGAA
jgi:hypothetical protein